MHLEILSGVVISDQSVLPLLCTLLYLTIGWYLMSRYPQSVSRTRMFIWIGSMFAAFPLLSPVQLTDNHWGYIKANTHAAGWLLAAYAIIRLSTQERREQRKMVLPLLVECWVVSVVAGLIATVYAQGQLYKYKNVISVLGEDGLSDLLVTVPLFLGAFYWVTWLMGQKSQQNGLAEAD